MGITMRSCYNWIDELKKEQGRSADMGLKEEELEIYDLLIQGRKLTKDEEKEVILASKKSL